MQDDSLSHLGPGYQPIPLGRPKRDRGLHALGRAVREARARRGFSQEELGSQSRLHRNYVGAIERGEINPTFKVLLKLAHGLDMPLSALLTTYERHRETPTLPAERPAIRHQPNLVVQPAMPRHTTKSWPGAPPGHDTAPR